MEAKEKSFEERWIEDEGYALGKRAGIKEVVDTFHDDFCNMANRFPTAKELTDFINKWQTKLKEWGVE